jgi:hypothetical protein
MGQNDQAVTAPVDVLAVLDRAYERLQDRGCEYARLIEARSAVAELITAAAEGVASGCLCETCERLRAALARAGGA